MVDKTVYFATGRRKESIARVRVIPGSGKIMINGIASDNYLQYSPNYIRISSSPIDTLGLEGKYDIHVKAEGGGLTGQTEAIRLGLAKALCKINPENRTALKFEDDGKTLIYGTKNSTTKVSVAKMSNEEIKDELDFEKKMLPYNQQHLDHQYLFCLPIAGYR